MIAGLSPIGTSSRSSALRLAGATLDPGSRADLPHGRGLKGNPDKDALGSEFTNADRLLFLDAADCQELKTDVAERIDYGSCR